MTSLVRRMLVAGLTGALTVSAAWAGAGLVPLAEDADVRTDRPVAEEGRDVAEAVAGTGDAMRADPTGTPDHPAPPRPGSGEMLVGAAKVDLYPQPEAYGGVWEQDFDTCATMSESAFTQLTGAPADTIAHYASTGSPWPENPNCLYMGGFGIGPINPIVDFDSEYGLWVRSVAIGDGDDTMVLTVIDAEGYFWDYDSKGDDYGIKQISQQLGEELGIPAENMVIAATHSHAAMDYLGGWGFVPDWYMEQTNDAIRTSIRDAVAAMQPATVEIGEERARPHNRERRDTYRSAEEQQLTWLRAREARSGRVIATVGAFAAHPTTMDTNDGIAHPDWPGVFEHRLEERFGGIGLHFMTGLGNMSAAGGVQMGARLADLVPAVGQGTPLTDTDLRMDRFVWNQPVTNAPLSALGLPGFFDRQFNSTPAQVRTGKSADTAPCVSASPVSVEVAVSAARIGDQFALTAAPGEVFANFTNTLKEQSRALVTMPLGQANDALGYMPQDFEMSPIGQQGLGFAAGGFLIVNYEDSYSIDHCYGDMALESTIDLLGALAES